MAAHPKDIDSSDSEDDAPPKYEVEDTPDDDFAAELEKSLASSASRPAAGAKSAAAVRSVLPGKPASFKERPQLEATTDASSAKVMDAGKPVKVVSCAMRRPKSGQSTTSSGGGYGAAGR
mmetsp:Transcript_68138/g.181318  ORF Transcript_68138/g.181318 Transcript_68138/m.181318 type:complete len:120 (+) Transcript_68138:51-410(+)